MYRSNSTDGEQVCSGVLNLRLELNDPAAGLPRVNPFKRVVGHGGLPENLRLWHFPPFS